jgi:hypothetical protein
MIMKPKGKGDYLKYTKDCFNARELIVSKLLMGLALPNPAYDPK